MTCNPTHDLGASWITSGPLECTVECFARHSIEKWYHQIIHTSCFHCLSQTGYTLASKPVASLLLNLFSIENSHRLWLTLRPLYPHLTWLLVSFHSQHIFPKKPVEPLFDSSSGAHRSRPRLRNLNGSAVWSVKSRGEETAEPLGQEVWDRLFRENQSYLWTAKRCWQSTKTKNHLECVKKQTEQKNNFLHNKPKFFHEFGLPLC